MNNTVTTKLRELHSAKTMCANNAKFYSNKKDAVEQELKKGLNVGANLRKRRELDKQLVKANARLVEANSLYIGYKEALNDLLGIGAEATALQG